MQSQGLSQLAVGETYESSGEAASWTINMKNAMADAKRRQLNSREEQIIIRTS
jgi:hypothetical protein